MTTPARTPLCSSVPAAAPTAPKPFKTRHESRCSICKHKDREMIETAFIQWRAVTEIAYDFDLSSRTTMYDHAHAFGLFERRARNVRFALEHIIEQAERIKPDARSVIEAIKVVSQLDEDGRWVRPPLRIEVNSQRFAPPALAEIVQSHPQLAAARSETLASDERQAVENSELLIGTPSGREPPVTP
jgi:hypothetical protein